MTATSGPAGRPTEPGLRTPGGSALLHIWWVASVMPYDSIAGTPNTRSSSCHTAGGNAADEDRTKRSPWTSGPARCRAAASTDWWMVGTAVYQVAPGSPSQSKNRSGSQPGVHTTPAPADHEDNAAPIRP